MKTNFTKKILKLSFEIEYRLLIIVTKLPFVRLVRNLFILRGIINLILDRDWRQLIQAGSVRRRTSHALGSCSWGIASLKRFIAYSLEESDMFLLRESGPTKKELDSLKKSCRRQLEHLTDRSSVVISYHFGSFILGILALSALNRPIYVLGSSIVESPKLPPALHEFFKKKYEIMERYLNGGEILFVEESNKMKNFFRYLSNGAIGVAMGDLLAGDNSSSIDLTIFNIRAKVQAGLPVFAKKRAIPIATYLCRRKLIGEPIFRATATIESDKNISQTIQDLFEEIIDTDTFNQDLWLIADSFQHLRKDRKL